MAVKKTKFKHKSKDMIDEALDIVKNTEDDDSAIKFLRETLNDDFPDLDLGRMDLHEAIEKLNYKEDKENKSHSQKVIEDLNKSLGDFLDIQEKKLNAVKKKQETKKISKPKKKSTKKKVAKKTTKKTTK